MKETKLEAAYRQVVNTDGSRAPRFTMQRCRAACRALADFHGELVLMEHWVSLNYTALVKILKKHDKRSNLSLRSPFLVSVLQQPFYSTEVLTQLITKTESRFRKLNALIASRGTRLRRMGVRRTGTLQMARIPRTTRTWWRRSAPQRCLYLCPGPKPQWSAGTV